MMSSRKLQTAKLGNKFSSALMLFAMLFSNIVAAFPASNVVVAAGDAAVATAGTSVDLGYDPSLAAPGPKPASGGYTIVPQDVFAGKDVSAYVSGPVTVDSGSVESGDHPLAPLFSPPDR